MLFCVSENEQADHKISFPVYEALPAYPFNQSNQIFRHGGLKVCTRDSNDQKQPTHYG